jgi:uncharacterized OsmC-like protein
MPRSSRNQRCRMKITLLDDDSIRLEPTPGALTIEALSPDQSYSPFHMLGSSLATCTFSVLQSWASHAKLDPDGLAIEVSWNFAEEPHRVAGMRMVIDWPGLPAERENAAKRVAEMCPIHHTLLANTLVEMTMPTR